MNDSTVEQPHPGDITKRQSEVWRKEDSGTDHIESQDGKMVLREAGLAAGVVNDAISQEQHAQNATKGDGSGFNTVVFVEPGTGMSVLHSKLA